MISILDSLCNSKNTLEKNQNDNDWLNFMQIFSLKKIIKKFYEGKLGESFIKWSYNYQNYVLCVFLTALQAYQKTSIVVNHNHDVIIQIQ